MEMSLGPVKSFKAFIGPPAKYEIGIPAILANIAIYCVISRLSYDVMNQKLVEFSKKLAKLGQDFLKH